MQQHPGAGISATEGALVRAAEHVGRARADVTALGGRLASDIDGMGARWGGEGARAFHRLHLAWQDKQRRIVGALDDFAESLHQTDRDNLATDQAQADLTATLVARLG